MKKEYWRDFFFKKERDGNENGHLSSDACLLKMFSKWIFLLSPPQDFSCLVIEQRIFPIPVPKQSKKFSRVKELKEEFLI